MTIKYTGPPYEISARSASGYPTRDITVVAGKDTQQPDGEPVMCLLLPPTNAPTGGGTVEELDYDEAVYLAEAIYANLDGLNRHQLRAAIDQIDQATNQSREGTNP